MNITQEYWAGTKICQKNLKSPQWLRNIKIKKPVLEVVYDKHTTY